MTKQDFIAKVALASQCTKRDTERVIAGVVETISQLLADRDKLTLQGFGTFETRFRNERKAHNMHTGEEIMVPAHYVAAFKPAKALKERVK